MIIQILNEKLWGIQKMGTLRPGASYTYTTEGDIIVAEDLETSERRIIGAKYPPTDAINWFDVLKEAEVNPALQNAVNHAIMLYELSRSHGKNRT